MWPGVTIAFTFRPPTANAQFSVNGNVLLHNLSQDAAADTIVGLVSGQPRLHGASETSGIAQIAFRTEPSTRYKGGITFSTNDTDGTDPASPPVERMRVTAAGRVGIGTTTPAYPLRLASGAYVSWGGVWTNASSPSLKQNIKILSLADAQAALAGLAPLTFVYKAEAGEPHVVFIAEDVPELVASVDRKSLSPMDIVAVLTKIVQDQQNTIAGHEATIADLQARLARLEAPVASVLSGGVK